MSYCIKLLLFALVAITKIAHIFYFATPLTEIFCNNRASICLALKFDRAIFDQTRSYEDV